MQRAEDGPTKSPIGERSRRLRKRGEEKSVGTTASPPVPGHPSHPSHPRREDGEADPLEKIKRHTYLMALLFGLPAIALLWASIGPSEAFATSLFPALGAIFVVCIAGLLAGMSVRIVERVVMVSTAGLFLGQLGFALYQAQSLDSIRIAITENIYTTLTVLYIVSYLILDNRSGLRVSVALYLIAATMVGARVIYDGPANLSSEELSWLLRMHAFMAAVIALLYTMAYAKTQFSRQRALSEAMKRLALTDQLTGVSNRRKLYMELQREVEESARYERPLCIILFDLDHFKEINDSYGHDRGDEVLRGVARSVEPLLRASDHFGRWGGEEFILVAPETRLDDAQRLAERLRVSISRVTEAPDGVTASFGVTDYCHEDSTEELIKRADRALYDAKASGRDSIAYRAA